MPSNGSQWITAFAAFEAARASYRASNQSMDEGACWRSADQMLLRRLQSGELPSRASSMFETWDDGFSLEPDLPPTRDSDGMFPVPPNFWASFARSEPSMKEHDWLAGDFTFRIEGHRPGWGQNGRGGVMGLEVDANCLPHVTLPPSDGERLVPSTEGIGGASRGRRPANWWPAFAEELAIYIHEEGIPSGQAHEGQSEMINEIFRRMVLIGKPEPSRSSVQPVINALLERLRSAKK